MSDLPSVLEQSQRYIDEALANTGDFQWIASTVPGARADGYIGMSLHVGSVTLVAWTADGQPAYDGTLVRGFTVVRLPQEVAKKLTEAAKAAIAAKEKTA